MRWNKFGIIALALALTGCASAKPALEAHSAGFGEAVANNIAAQRIAPTAEDKANTFIPPNRARQKAAREAYENGTVIEPVSVETTE
jgi:hypothetical protein